jgi:DNA-binding response OmpR family regulator
VRVLLLETEARALPVVRAIFARFVDSLVTLEYTVVDAVVASSIAEADVDVVVLARDRWGETDTALCRALREERLAVPVLAVSGPCKPRQCVAALRAGADDFLRVPFDSGELVARVLALVRRASSRSRYVRAGVFAVDFTRRHVFINGRRLVLTLREFDLLAALVDHSGEVVTRRTLAECATPVPTKGDSNAVDVHMSRIRVKLGTYATTVETVRGIGYRLRLPEHER